jgi:hypothetical protein
MKNFPGIPAAPKIVQLIIRVLMDFHQVTPSSPPTPRQQTRIFFSGWTAKSIFLPDWTLQDKLFTLCYSVEGSPERTIYMCIVYKIHTHIHTFSTTAYINTVYGGWERDRSPMIMSAAMVSFNR